MTAVSQHTYTAEIADLATPLSMTGGRVTLDAGSIPYARGSLTLAVEDAALLGDLDPRDSRRVIIGATGTFGDSTRSRSFNMGIRSVSPNRADGTAQIELASDEALLQDFAPLADDNGPRAHEASLRGVCGYVLDKIGATLDPGTADADVTAYWEVTNQVTNPQASVDAASWLGVGNATSIQRSVMAFPPPPVGGYAIRFTAGNGSSNIAPVAAVSDFTVTPGRWYTFSYYIASSVARSALAILQWRNANGSVIVGSTLGAITATTNAEFRRMTVIGQAPAGVTHVLPYVQTQGNVSGNLHYVTCAMFYEGAEVIPYFNGTDPLPGYTVAWQGDAHKSASTRTPDVERRPEALTWSAGVSGMDFLHPLLQTAGLRLVCDAERRWTLRSEEYRAPGAQSWRYGVNITAADESLSRADESWFDAAVYEYRWTDRDGIEQTRVDAYSVSATPTKVLRRELNTPYPGPGRAQHIVTRAQGKGRSVTVSGIPTWREQTDQALSILLDGTPIQTGISSSIEYDFDTDTVTITSRTTDTPAGAIDLLPGTINALTGTISDL